MAWKERKDRVEDINVKDTFEEHYKILLGKDYEKFFNIIEKIKKIVNEIRKVELVVEIAGK